MNSLVYQAPWGKALRWTSAISVLLIAGVAIAILVTDKNRSAGLAVLLLPALLLGTALFAIRTYTIEPTELLIRRLLWTTRLPLNGLQSAEFVPNAMSRSIRLCGNGGMFSFTGWYRNRALGNYRAFVTELKNTVVLRFANKTIVISPENPEHFVSEINLLTNRNS